MKPFSIAAVVGLAGIAAVHAQESSSSVGVPGQLLDRPSHVQKEPLPQLIAFQSETHQFGRIAAGVVAEHDFPFTNASDSPAIIERVEPDCHCTTVGQWKMTLNPGESGVIPVKYSSSGYHGPIDQTIKVFSEDADRPPIILHMKGEVWQPVELNPIKADFTLSREQKNPATRSIRIRTRSGDLHFTSEPESTNKAFEAKCRTVTEGKDYYVDISTVGALPPGSVKGEITVKTDSPNLPLVTIPISAFVPADVSCTPPLVRLPPGPVAKTTEQRFMVRNNADEPLVLKSVQSSLPEVRVEVKEVREGRLFQVIARLPENLELSGKKLTVTIQTNSKETPEIQIPITQLRLVALGS